MTLVLYTAPNCIRCKTVKAWLADRGIEYRAVDFKEDAKEFNAFYRANRKSIFRGAEGVEFPLLEDGSEVRQGSGVILAWLVAGRALDAAIGRSDLWHGWISGIYPSLCPAGEEEHFLEVLAWLKKGGLFTLLQVDGNRPDVLEQALSRGLVDKVVLNVPGGAAAYESLGLAAPSEADLARSIELVKGTQQGVVQFLARPLPEGDGWRWPARAEALAAAEMVYNACRDHSLPYGLAVATADMPLDMHGLEPMDEQLLVKFRSAARQVLFTAGVAAKAY